MAEHHFDGSVDAVETVLSDPSFYLDLDLPDLSRPEVTETTVLGDATRITLRYEFEGSLDPIAQRLIGSGRLAWIQTVSLDRAAHTGTLQFAAEKEPRRLNGSADIAFTAREDGTVRRITGELVVAVPAVGRMAERRIVPGLVRRMDIEAEAVAARLAVR